MMRYGYTREEQDKAAQQIIAGYRETAALFPILRKTAEAWDGKVFNKRFTEALCTATGKHVYTYISGEYIHFYLYEGCNRQYTLMSIKRPEMTDGKRLVAKILIANARNHREEYLRKAAELEATAEKVDELKAQIESVKNLLRRLGDSIPYEAREIWGIDTRSHF